VRASLRDGPPDVPLIEPAECLAHVVFHLAGVCLELRWELCERGLELALRVAPERL
jgi:hypothetical protein